MFRFYIHPQSYADKMHGLCRLPLVVKKISLVSCRKISRKTLSLFIPTKWIKSILLRPNISCLKQYFTNRPYDGFSNVSTGLKCTIQASVQHRRVLSPAVSKHGLYLRSAWCARAPSHLYLVIYTYYLGVRRLSIILGSGGSTVFYAHTRSSFHCVCVFYM